MANAYFTPPFAINEPVLSYAPGSQEREAIKATIREIKATEHNVPMIIGGKEIYTEQTEIMRPPHELSHTLGYHAVGDKTHVQMAIDAALEAKSDWEEMPWQSRAAIFLKAADLISGPYRAHMNAATMLCQSKTVHQSEIDAVCELADFLRFNVQYMTEIYADQPDSTKNIWNRMEYRPLEGFVFALTPFNFTAISGNLPTAPALMGNTVVWKPAQSQIFAASVVMEVLREAGLPDGVINLIFVDGPTTGSVVFEHRDFAGIHFTGGTSTFHLIWKTIASNLPKYRSFPRIVGETGGKDFVLAHHSADIRALSTALVRGAFEYQGQKCSAASRAYIPKGLWPELWSLLERDIKSIKMGSVENFSNFIGAVIDSKSYSKITGYIAQAKKDTDAAEILIGGNFSDDKGYFIEPTVILAKDPKYITMEEEIFGPVLTVYLYEDDKFDETMELLDNTSPYALTGAVFAQDRAVIHKATETLRHSAGNFYINDKPTGAVVGQQPFGGARGSGTNDKAGSSLNLLRWVSARSIKENFVPPTDYRYPFMEE